MSIELELDELQRAGFPMGGEPLVALDLADTLMLAVDPPADLLADAGGTEKWWGLQGRRLPGGPVPDPAATRRLRAAIRDLLDSHLEHRAPRETSVEDVNAAAAAVPVSERLVASAETMHREIRWHAEFGGNIRLAAIAREVIELMSSPEQLARLRRCANPDCSMLFLAASSRRQWCTPNICGNRARVARHYHRHRTEGTAD